jgi:hypothetical protein
MSNLQNAPTVWETNSISSVLQKIHFQHTTKNLRSLSVLSEERAEGKTTVSVLLSKGLSEIYKFKVLLVDLNPAGDPLLNVHLKDYASKDGLVMNHPFPFDIFRLKDLEVDWSKTMINELYISRMIGSFSKVYDLVIVDTANSFKAVNTDSNLVICTERSFGSDQNKIKNEILLNRKEVLGILFNK